MANLQDLDGIIFDYGGVLVSHQQGAEIDQLAGLLGLSRTEFDERYWRNRLDYDRDKYTTTEYWRDVANGRALTDEQVGALSSIDTASWMHYDPIMWEWVEQLRQGGKRVAVLSNMPRDLGLRLRTETNRFDLFDHVTLSYELASAKPDRYIYEHCLEGIGTKPERTLFLDDRVVNIEAARSLGIQAIEFSSREDVLPALL